MRYDTLPVLIKRQLVSTQIIESLRKPKDASKNKISGNRLLPPQKKRSGPTFLHCSPLTAHHPPTSSLPIADSICVLQKSLAMLYPCGLDLLKTLKLQRYPLRGELFENFVISEQFKRKFNVARRPNFHFYRDNLQKEIDLIEDDGGKIRAYEIKAPRTFHKDFFKNLDCFRSIFGDDIVSTQVIYDGESELNAPKNGVVNFRNI